MNSNNCTIWVSYHKDEQVHDFCLDSYVKGDDNPHKLFATHHNIDGQNINIMNPVYSEMVTMWYVWKNNIKSEYVGFEHYRRRLDIEGIDLEDGQCLVYREVSMSPDTLYSQYAKYHNKADMDIVIDILEEVYGVKNVYIKHIKENSVFLPNCTFLMKWEDFTLMCNFMFDIAERFSQRVGISGFDEESLHKWEQKSVRDFRGINYKYQTRVMSFLIERLISAWISSHLSYIVAGRNIHMFPYEK